MRILASFWQGTDDANLAKTRSAGDNRMIGLCLRELHALTFAPFYFVSIRRMRFFRCQFSRNLSCKSPRNLENIIEVVLYIN